MEKQRGGVLARPPSRGRRVRTGLEETCVPHLLGVRFKGPFAT